MDQDGTWRGGGPRSRPHCPRWGPSFLPPPKKGRAPSQCSAHVYCGQTALCIRILLGTEVGLSVGDTALDGDPAPPPLKGHSQQFLANVRCSQTAGWTKMPLGMEVGLGPGDFALDEDPASPQKTGTAPTQFLAHVYCGQTLDGSRCHLVRR